jgi:hypothetical protein
MSFARSILRLLPVAAVVVVTACQDLAEPTSPMNPSFSAQNGAGSPGNSGNAPGQDVRAWFAAASPEIMAQAGLVFAAIDEGTNQLVFGVEHASATRGVQTALERRGIPAQAARVVVVQPIEFMSDNLRSAHRPTVGGLQINFPGYLCTLGFNVDHEGGRSFITNSHCTATQGTTGTTPYYQPLQSSHPEAIAIEAHDPAYTSIAGCSSGKQCRLSDAARALYQESAASTRGVIAKTTGVNSGSLTVSGSFAVATQDNTTTSFAAGTVLNKVGRTTGWTSGSVTSTCATVNVANTSIQLLCQTLVQNSGVRIVQGGDSGSPVFHVTSGDDVQLVGILWGGNSTGETFVFSPLKNIQQELGAMTATSAATTSEPLPPPPSTDGGGTGGGSTCTPRGKSGNCK